MMMETSLLRYLMVMNTRVPMKKYISQERYQTQDMHRLDYSVGK
jgi:2-hydroxychromene-2-carboxylate isomerase